MGKQEKNIAKLILFLGEKPRSKMEIMDYMGFSESSWQKYTGHLNKMLAQEKKKLNLYKR